MDDAQPETRYKLRIVFLANAAETEPYIYEQEFATREQAFDECERICVLRDQLPFRVNIKPATRNK